MVPFARPRAEPVLDAGQKFRRQGDLRQQDQFLPPEAQRIEHVRRALLDLFHGHGYELVMPPLLEYVESLLTGTGRDMDLATFKLVDQLSGRQIGIRADITPQVVRIERTMRGTSAATDSSP